MSITNRPFSAGFGTGRHARAFAASHWGWGHATTAEPRAPERENSLTSYPWEGLYLEVDETTTQAAATAPLPGAPLGQFLTNLMYAE